MAKLLSTSARVQVPHITVAIGDYTFGLYARKKTKIEVNSQYYDGVKTTYPNYMKSLNVVKVNGALNTYTLVMEYGITAKDDPNMFEKVFSSVSKTRKIVFTYGDCALPNYMYREEEALITRIQTNLDTVNAKITYTITAVSGAVKSTAGVFSFPAYSKKKPSDVILSTLQNPLYGLQEIFYGMFDIETVLSKGIILRDDKEVTIPAKNAMTPWDYICYLVSCMVSETESSNSVVRGSSYTICVKDSTNEYLSGPYFQIYNVSSKIPSSSSVDYYTVDVGYPGTDFVSSFVVNNDESYAILYDYADKVHMSDYIYRIGDDGNVNEIFSPTLTNSKEKMITSEADRSWWTNITQYPIKATLQIRGLLRAILLMSYIRINVYYYGRKHVSSGVYVVTRQEDTVNEQGYFTTLNLLKVGGDE